MKRQDWSRRWGDPKFSPAWWLDGPHPLIQRTVESGWLQPCQLLEIGCGTGQQAAWLQERSFQVTAFDFAPEAIEIAKTTHSGPTFLVADATAQAGVSGAFDAIVDVGCFHGLEDHSAYLANILLWSKPGAKFALVARCGEFQPYQRFQQVRDIFCDSFSLHSYETRGGTLPRMPAMEMMIFRLSKS
jgi:SAM-dependent methyltransferase